MQSIYSDVACPGLVLTQMTLGILGKWFWTLILPLLLLVSGTLSHVQCIYEYPPPIPPQVRTFVTPTLTMNPYNGSEALVSRVCRKTLCFVLHAACQYSVFSSGDMLSQVWLARQTPYSLDRNRKYYSKVTAFGRRYVDHRQVCMCVCVCL